MGRISLVYPYKTHIFYLLKMYVKKYSYVMFITFLRWELYVHRLVTTGLCKTLTILTYCNCKNKWRNINYSKHMIQIRSGISVTKCKICWVMTPTCVIMLSPKKPGFAAYWCAHYFFLHKSQEKLAGGVKSVDRWGGQFSAARSKVAQYNMAGWWCR